MIKITRLWSGVDDKNNITILRRPRISIKVDEYVWGLIEENIVIPKKIMQSSLYDYELVVSLKKYDPETCLFFPYSPYNGYLKENATSSTYRNPTKYYHREDFVDGEKRTKWFSLDKFWTNEGVKMALIFGCAENVSEHIAPIEYADLLFDAFAATLLHNFKKLKKTEFDELKTHINHDIVCGFPFPAPFSEQKYQGDDRYLRVSEIRDGVEKILIDIPSIEVFYKQHYSE